MKLADRNIVNDDLRLSDDDLIDLELDSSIRSPPAKRARTLPNTIPKEPEPITVRYRRVLKHVPTIPYVPLTTSNGVRLYLRLHSDQDVIRLESDVPRIVEHTPKPYKRLLSVEFSALRLEAEALKDRFNALVARLSPEEKENDPASDEIEEMDTMPLVTLRPFDEISSVDHDVAVLSKKDDKEKIKLVSKLWVEKYKPSGYMDLLSEEAVNQSLLHWVKLWDNCVFGKDYLAKFKEIKEKYAKIEENEKGNKEWKTKLQPSLVDDESYDDLGRPKQKIVLLHGPAGLGKTTAAHIVAKHSGYNIIEMNASDDRSTDVFRRVLDSTTESRSEMFQSGRPNCLVIDEIDGSPPATVEILVNLVSGKSKESGKSKKKKVLRRPIICICNDLYTPALKNLRPIALVLQFQPIPLSTLVERIEQISFKENLRLDHSMLNCIAEKSECDIRSCLSTMQFIKQRNGNVTHKLLDHLGTKDKSKGLFGVWEDVFFLPQSKKYYESKDPTRADSRFHNVLQTAQNFGDYEKLQSGVFQNYLRTSLRDTYFQKVLKGLEWNIWFDELQEKINKMQNYSLLGYLPTYFVANHFLFASRRRFMLQYPASASNLYNQTTRHLANFKTQLSEIQPMIAKFVNIREAILDIFPAMLGIIQPATIRPIPAQLWSPRERECLRNIVSIMIAYNMNYIQQRNNEGSYIYLLDSNMEEFARFQHEEGAVKQKQFPYAIKQMIAREIEVEKMRKEEPKGIRLEESYKSSNSKSDHHQSSVAVGKNSEIDDTQDKPKPLPNWKQFAAKPDKNKPIKTTEPKDFFGRAIIPKPISAEQEKVNEQKARASEIWYKFKEGYSNAVRKKLKVKDFL